MSTKIFLTGLILIGLPIWFGLTGLATAHGLG